MPKFLFLLLSLTSLAPAPPAVNGVKIVTRQVTGGFIDTRTEYLTTDRLRNEWQTQMGGHQGPPMASIVQRGDHNRVFVLDLQAHEYMTYETDSRGVTMGTDARPISNSGGTLEISIENIDTGERKEMFGHVARHIITRENASPARVPVRAVQTVKRTAGTLILPSCRSGAAPGNTKPALWWRL